LSQYWNQAEFNVFGDGGDSHANFNSGSTVVVRTSVDHGNAYAPICDGYSFTAETNNLNFLSARTAQAEALPAIVFAESNTGIAVSPCASATNLEGTTRLYQQGKPWVGSGCVIGYQGDVPEEGKSVALSADGKTAIIGGPGDGSGAPDSGRNVGAVWIFTQSGGVWSQQAKLVGTDVSGIIGQAQGTSVALSADGNTAIAGGILDNNGVGAAWIWTRSGNTWTQQTKLVATGYAGTSPYVGYSVALSANGNTAIIGAPLDHPLNDGGIGAAWVFTRSGTIWQSGLKLVGSGYVGGSGQGISVALSADGIIAVVGGQTDNPTCSTCGGVLGLGVGAVWVFTQNGGVWPQQGPKLTVSGLNEQWSTNVGASVALSADGTTALIGAPLTVRDNVGVGAITFFHNGTAPLVTAISPHDGPSTGGTSAEILGSNFTGATAAYFGSVAASSFTVNTAGSITVTSPAGTNGTVDVTVHGLNGTSAISASDQFTYD
jgi:hypothetical protein